ncbi:MAG: tyrosine-type recombinase/integrase [Bacteroidales bacterium]|jgi:integrase/recombinase XerC|nr:tyrosine-type recombinase/integrase [Bacteroidales bacterium]
MNFDSFVEYLKAEKGYSNNTVIAYLNDLNQFEKVIEESCGVTSELDVTPSMIRIWMVNLKDKEISNRSIGRKVACIRLYFNFLTREGVLSVNPMLKIVAPKVQQTNRDYIFGKEMEQLLLVKSEDKSFAGVRDHLILEMLYSTGIRQSELLDLCDEDIDFEGMEIRVLGKARKERLIPVHPEVMGRIKYYLERKKETNATTNAFLLNNKLQPMSKKQLYSFVCKEVAMLQSANSASPHTLRHSFATNTLAEGADLTAIQKLMGHSTIASTQVYTHTTIEELKKAYKLAHPSAEVDID